MQKCLHILYRTEIWAILAYFLSKFGCHGNSLCNSLENLPKFGCHGNCLGSLKISHSILEFADPQNPTIYATIVTISCTKLTSVQFWLFCLNLVAMATPFAPLKIPIVYISICRLLRPYYSHRRLLSILYKTEISPILPYFA